MADIQSSSLWAACCGEDGYHVIPLDDLKEHDDNAGCWCGPEVEEEDEGRVIVHHSMDGREAFENGERLPS